MNTLQDQWEKFSTLVVPKDAPPIQKIEMKRSFYAGAHAYFHLIAGDLCDVSDDAGVAMIEGWRQEIETFAAEVKAGRA